MNQEQTPLISALINHKEKNTWSYHVPGHKNGQVFPRESRSYFHSILEIDVTELNGLDDLHAPEGPILEAQQLLAQWYGAEKSYFLVNGSTVGNIAMILGVCVEGDTVLVQKNCHKSILHGLMLANVKPVFLSPHIDKKWGVASHLEFETIKSALAFYPETKAIILTNPNYYGQSASLKEIIGLAHEREIPVLVDEAHGAHFCLSDSFPVSALACGADLVVHSAHKTLPAMTMGSYLHCNSTLVNKERVEFYLQMLQSSSPSYPIMASLDLARAYLAAFTKEDEKSLLDRIHTFRGQLQNIAGLSIMEAGQTTAIDPLKVTIRAWRGTGFDLQAQLEVRGIYSELADAKNVLLILPLLKVDMSYPFQETVQKIQDAVNTCSTYDVLHEDIYDFETSSITSLALSYTEMKTKTKNLVSFSESIGRIAAEMIIPYPPGIPLIMIGEKISPGKVVQLESLLRCGSRFHGGVALNQEQLQVY